VTLRSGNITAMQIQFKIDKKDDDVLFVKYDTRIDWKLLSYSATSAYNWIIPNRSSKINSIPIRLKKTDGLAGWFNYGQSLYINLDYNEDLSEFIRTLFHELRHWIQFHIDKRPAHSLVTKKEKHWCCENAEKEAQDWEEIGEKILDIYNILAYSKLKHANEYSNRNNKRKHRS